MHDCNEARRPENAKKTRYKQMFACKFILKSVVTKPVERQTMFAHLFSEKDYFKLITMQYEHVNTLRSFSNKLFTYHILDSS